VEPVGDVADNLLSLGRADQVGFGEKKDDARGQLTEFLEELEVIAGQGGVAADADQGRFDSWQPLFGSLGVMKKSAIQAGCVDKFQRI